MAGNVNWGAVHASNRNQRRPRTVEKTPIPRFWIKNIEKLRSICQRGIVYFDLVARPDSYSVMVACVKYGHPDYKDNSVEFFLIYRDTKKMNDSTHHLGSFIEPAACAALLTVQGFEVYYGLKAWWMDRPPKEEADDDLYISFSETIFDLAAEEKQNKLGELLGGTFMEEKPVISNSSPPLFTDYRKYISTEELNG